MEYCYSYFTASNLNFSGGLMNYTLILISSLLLSISFGQYDFSMEDVNNTSPFYENNVGPSIFPEQVLMVYFGHYS